MKLISVSILLVVFATSFAQEKSYNPKSNEVKALFGLRNALLNYTGNPYLYTDSVKIARAFDSTANVIENEKSALERFRIYCRLTAMIHDGHTNLIPTSKLSSGFFNGKNNPPMDVSFIDRNLYVTSTYRSAKNIEKGEEILTINGDSISHILNTIYLHQNSDGFNKTLHKELLKNFFWYFYWLYVNDSQLFSMNIKNQKGEVFSIDIKGVAPKKKIYFENYNDEMAVSVPKKIGYPTLEINNELRYGYLKIGTFLNPNQLKYEKVIRSHMLTIKNSGIGNLIIDLRNNSGGRFEPYILGIFLDSIVPVFQMNLKSMPDATKLKGVEKSGYYYFKHKNDLKMIKQLKAAGIDISQFETFYSILISEDFRFDGNLVVLVNGKTFSAASVFASQLKYYVGAKIIGQETGGSYLHGNTGQLVYKLPYFRYQLSLNPIYFNAMVPDYQDYKGGLLPDIEIREIFDQREDLHIKAAQNYFDTLKN